jgi:hypothetical protein
LKKSSEHKDFEKYLPQEKEISLYIDISTSI